MNPDEIKWVEAPTDGRKGPANALSELVAILKENPGRWAAYPQRMSGGWIAIARKNHPGLKVRAVNVATDPDGKIRYDYLMMWPGDD